MPATERTVRHLRMGLADLVSVLALVCFAVVLSHVPSPDGMGLPHEEWYGNSRGVLVVTALFTAFLFAFVRPRRTVEWRNTGFLPWGGNRW